MRSYLKAPHTSSLAVLIQGVIIKRLGHKTHILEQHPASIRYVQAAGISVGPYIQEFLRRLDHCDGTYALQSPGLQYVDKDLNVTGTRGSLMAFTSRNLLYYRLRAKSDGLKS